MSEPLVSVIIPTYRRAHLVNRAVQSALNQTYTNIEVVVVIDGANDGTRATVESLGDSRVRVIETGTNQGPAAARNLGVRHSVGRYIALLDDDDEWTPEKLATQLKAVSQHRWTGDFLVSCRIIEPSNGSRVVPKRLFQQHEDFSEYILDRYLPFRRGAVASGSLLFPRSLVSRVPFPTDRVMEDYGWLLLCICQHRTPLFMCPEPMFIYHMAEAVSRNKVMDWRLSLEWARRYRSYMTGTAFSGLLATTTVWRAKRQGGYRAFAEIIRAMRQEGDPRLIHWFLIGSVACVPHCLADRLRRSVS